MCVCGGGVWQKEKEAEGSRVRVKAGEGCCTDGLSSLTESAHVQWRESATS